MFFFISKILHFVLNPFFWVELFLIFAILRIRKSNPNPYSGWKKWSTAIYYHSAKSHIVKVLLIVFIAGNNVLANELLLLWETPISKNKVHLDSNCPKTAVVLGGFGNYNIDQDWYRLNDASERLLTGMEGLVNQRFDRVILSGGNSNILDKRFFDATNAKNYLSRFKIDTSKVIIDNNARNTIENAYYTKLILDSLKIKEPILMITSATHMRRSIKCYEKYNIPIIPYPVQHLGNSDRRYDIQSFLIPSSHAMDKTQNLLHEWVGYTMYKLTGKIN